MLDFACIQRGKSSYLVTNFLVGLNPPDAVVYKYEELSGWKLVAILGIQTYGHFPEKCLRFFFLENIN